jgi:putative membrane-bound dehydrogenase-like protein
MSIPRIATLSAWVVTAALAAAVSQQPPSPPGGGNQRLQVPDGFEVELAAGPPLVDRPIVADFDEQGRLYVADSSGSNDKVDKQLADKPHRIVRLEDADGDGRFDTRVVFADRMMFPEGTMWFEGSLYVAAPPSIWKLTDTDGDGVADQREEWFQGKTLTGCANDLHGPYAGPDGLIYWTKGAFAEQTYERPGQAPFVTRASHIFRRRPGTSEVEPVMTGGMDNPVDVAFTSSGERILTATFLEHPQQGRRDAIVHAVYGGLYGKPHAVIDGHARTGDLMPVLCELGPAVPAGLTRYASRVFGDEYRDNFFAAMFNLRKVTRHVLEPDGATFRSKDSDFLVSQDRDFHPTDVIEDADGSLLVVDTGPWYKLCCPTSQLAKPDLPGAIYRVRRKGAAAAADPRGSRIAFDSASPRQLTAVLADARPIVQARAVHQLGKLGDAAIPALREAIGTFQSADARRNAVWALTRIGSQEARGAVRTALRDVDETVRRTAIYSAGLWRDGAARPQLVDALQSPVPAVRRVAAEALGRVGSAEAVAALVSAAATSSDRVLDHSITYALIEIGKPQGVEAALAAAPAPRSVRAALIALDQIGGSLGPARIMPLLDSTERVVSDTAWWIAERHPEWGDALAGYFRQRFDGPLNATERADLARRIGRFAASAPIQALLAALVQSGSADARGAALEAMAATRQKTLPSAWIAPLTAAVEGGSATEARQALAVLRSSPPPETSVAPLTAALVRAARDESRPEEVRVGALAAVPGGMRAVGPGEFALLQSSLRPDRAPLVKSDAAGVIEKATLDRAQLLALAASLETSGPLELSRLIAAFDKSADEEVGLRMVASLERARSRSTLRPDMLRPRLEKYPASVKQKGEALLAAVNVEASKQAQHLEGLLTGIGGGDVRRGQSVFNSEKAACMTCHAIGYVGGRIGPDLTRIGQVRTERDLLEAVVFPSASFARSYEPVIVETKTGEVYNGVIRSDAGDEVVLGTGAAEDMRIPRAAIRDMRPGTTSLMPSGLGDQLTRQELADLIAFLKATRSGA